MLLFAPRFWIWTRRRRCPRSDRFYNRFSELTRVAFKRPTDFDSVHERSRKAPRAHRHRVGGPRCSDLEISFHPGSKFPEHQSLQIMTPKFKIIGAVAVAAILYFFRGHYFEEGPWDNFRSHTTIVHRWEWWGFENWKYEVKWIDPTGPLPEGAQWERVWYVRKSGGTWGKCQPGVDPLYGFR